ncbi:hypothetical protein GN244_ATG15859 [Phytophthora infestans]|uniref:Chromo domain-containing protein n=1 Tax=Phytophthora infestans TaxID=4787 RepID=A0A833SLS0_PHYIN|nr:hypothetical protein GN244_ATG15859 [Phytophthora infestans]
MVSVRHASRLQLYRDALRGTVEDLLEHTINGECGHLVEALLDCRLSPATHRWGILVNWVGKDDVEASWEPAEAIQEDVPTLLQTFLDEPADNPLRQRLAASLADAQGRATAQPVTPSRRWSTEGAPEIIPSKPRGK